MTTRSDAYLSAVLAVLLLVVGLTILTTAVITTSEVGPVIITGTVIAIAGTICSLATGYRAARHYANVNTNRAAADLVRKIVAHDARLASEPPEATIVMIEQRRQSRESTT